MSSHEVHCFQQRTGLEPHQLTVLNITQNAPNMAQLLQFDVVFVGGSGDFYISKRNQPFLTEFLDCLNEITQLNRPMFCACYGFQALIMALGGDLCFDPDNMEVGTYPLMLTDAGRSDPLFSKVPPSFDVQMGHKDRVVCYPEGMENLAYSKKVTFQATRVPNAPIWAVQFHPELTGKSNLDRYHHYLEGYSTHLDEGEKDAVKGRFWDSPESSGLLLNFLQLVF
jgi:GMP synthase (glutamine-hydrolysing)